MIGVADYGASNLRSVQKAFGRLGGKVIVSGDREALSRCSRLVLPGVGSFPAGIKGLKEAGLFELFRTFEGPLLGICLGMQFLLEESEEGGLSGGLGRIKGRVLPFTEGKVPCIGWNEAEELSSPLFEGIPDGTRFYFVHSYFCDAAKENVIATTEYYRRYASAVRAGNCYGVQFHPEKSGEAGLALLENFMRL